MTRCDEDRVDIQQKKSLLNALIGKKQTLSGFGEGDIVMMSV
jgi:hypothetical protein